LNLVKVAVMLKNFEFTPDGRTMYRMLLSLIELQRLAYALDTQRTQKNILRAYNHSFLFAMKCMELFKEPKTCSKRAMFGMPFHCLTVHLPETLRIVSGRSLVAESAERHFHKLRYKLSFDGIYLGY